MCTLLLGNKSPYGNLFPSFLCNKTKFYDKSKVFLQKIIGMEIAINIDIRIYINYFNLGGKLLWKHRERN